MKFNMKILMPNETLRKFHFPIKLDDNPNDQWNWRIRPLPNLGHLDEVLELHHGQFHPFNFNILFFYYNYFKLRTTKMIYR